MSEDFQKKAKRLVFDYIKPRLEKTDKHVTFAPDEVYVVWWSKVLQNWKCLISTTLPDGMYYEVTYNGDKGETYIDAYKKFDNVCVPDGWKPEPPDEFNEDRKARGLLPMDEKMKAIHYPGTN